MKKFAKSLLAMFLSVAVLTGVALSVGCNKNSGNNDELRFFLAYGDYVSDVNKDSVWLELENKTGVTFSVEGHAHDANYYSKLTPMINSQDIPDLVFAVPDDSAGAYEQYVAQNCFYDIDDLLAERPDDYPYLRAVMNSEQYKNIYYLDGSGNKVRTLIPKLGEHSGWGIYYRKDWLEEIGFVDQQGNVKTPVTIEEFAYVVSEFSGKGTYSFNQSKTTYGFTAGINSDIIYLTPLMHAFGVEYGFSLDDDNEVTWMYEQEEINDFITWFKSLVDAGYIDKQINTVTDEDAREKFVTGYAGILITNTGTTTATISSNLYAQSGGTIMFGNAPVGTADVGVEGVGGFSDFGGYWGGFSIGITCTRPHDVLKFLDYVYSPEGGMLCAYGIEGVHYTIEDGRVVANTDNRESEPYPSRFYLSTNKEGDSYETGYYRMGMMLAPSPIDWETYAETGELVLIFDSYAQDAENVDLLEQAYEKNSPLAVSDLLNMTLCLNSMDNIYINKIKDVTSAYVLNNIIGSKDAMTYQQMLNTINGESYQWYSLQQKIKNRAVECGILIG